MVKKFSNRGEIIGWHGIFLSICITLAIFAVFLVGVDTFLSFPLTQRQYNNATIPAYFSYENITVISKTGDFQLVRGSAGYGSTGTIPNQVSWGWFDNSIFTAHPQDAIFIHHNDGTVLLFGNIIYHPLTHNAPYDLTGTREGALVSQTQQSKESLNLNETLQDYKSDKGYSYTVWKCDHFTWYLFIHPYLTTKTMEQSWNDGKLNVTWGYGMNFTASSVSAWQIIGQILTFQTPQLGLGTGLAGYIITSLIAIPLWFGLIFVAYKLLTGLIPFLSGGG